VENVILCPLIWKKYIINFLIHIYIFKALISIYLKKMIIWKVKNSRMAWLPCIALIRKWTWGQGLVGPTDSDEFTFWICWRGTWFLTAPLLRNMHMGKATLQATCTTLVVQMHKINSSLSVSLMLQTKFCPWNYARYVFQKNSNI